MPVQAPWRLADDPLRDRRGFLVMVDLRGVASGPHELAVQLPPPARDDDTPDTSWRSPFWN